MVAHARCDPDKESMKLQQNQIWLKGSEYYRIVQLDRAEVQYKIMTDPLSGRGPHHQVTKKEFCRCSKKINTPKLQPLLLEAKRCFWKASSF
jgi:hypothetical protein